jgi:hypothetical protein
MATPPHDSGAKATESTTLAKHFATLTSSTPSCTAAAGNTPCSSHSRAGVPSGASHLLWTGPDVQKCHPLSVLSGCMTQRKARYLVPPSSPCTLLPKPSRSIAFKELSELRSNEANSWKQGTEARRQRGPAGARRLPRSFHPISRRKQEAFHPHSEATPLCTQQAVAVCMHAAHIT